MVTDEPAAAGLVRGLGARTVGDEPDGGLNAALEHGAAGARAGDAVAALSSDLPALRPARARRRARRRRRGARAASSPTCTAPAPRCSPRSGRRCARGSAPGRRRPTGTTARVALTGDWPGLLRDVDALDDLRAAVALGRRTAHGAVLVATRRLSPFTSVRHDDRVPTPDDAPLPADRFLNRELSWLDFNARVLELAEDEHAAAARAGEVPGDLRQQPRRVLHGPHRRAEAPAEHRADRPLPRRADHPGAAGAGHRRARRSWCSGTPTSSTRTCCPAWRTRASGSSAGTSWRSDAAPRLREYFRDQVFPVLTPLAVDPAHPFPYISGLSLNLAVSVHDPDTGRAPLRPAQGAQQRAAVRAGRPPTDADGGLPAARGPHRRAPQPALPGAGRARPPLLPGHPQRRRRGGGGPRRGPAAGPRAGAGPAPVRPRGAAGGRRADGPADPRGARLRAGGLRRTTSSTCPGCSTSPR